MTTSALCIDGLSVSYGAVRAVHDLSLEVAAGSCVALIGANGAGKTSVLKGIGGLAASRARAIQLTGTELGGKDPALRARAGLAHVLEGRHVFPGISVRDNLRLGAVASGRRADVDAVLGDVLALLPELEPALGKPAGVLSGGQQQMLAIGRALAGRPTVVMMDEPTNGLAPMLVRRVTEIIASICERGVAVLLVEQRLEVAQAVATRVHVLQRGRMIREMAARDSELDGFVHAAYLG